LPLALTIEAFLLFKMATKLSWKLKEWAALQ